MDSTASLILTASIASGIRSRAACESGQRIAETRVCNIIYSDPRSVRANGAQVVDMQIYVNSPTL